MYLIYRFGAEKHIWINLTDLKSHTVVQHTLPKIYNNNYLSTSIIFALQLFFLFEINNNIS